jgi:hypothetical protein
LLWTVSGLGAGIASISVAGGLIFTTGYHEESEFAYALEAEPGAARWAARIGPSVRECPLMRWLSQRAPTVVGDRVYVLSAVPRNGVTHEWGQISQFDIVSSQCLDADRPGRLSNIEI